jgi:hypothetical protein
MPHAGEYRWSAALWPVTRVACGVLALVAPIDARTQTPSPAPLASYRTRILGVFDLQSGDPIEGAEVIDVFAHVTAVTTKTGTVSLAFLPEGGSMLRIQKIGFKPITQIVEISPADTVAITLLMEATAQTLPTVVTKDSAQRFVSPGLREFEERRKTGFGRFITEAELRKNDNRSLTNVVRQSGGAVSCTRRTPIKCFAVNARAGGSGCSLDVYYDGVLVNDDNRDLEQIPTSQIGAVELYASTATVPAMYNKTGKGCGVMLLWSRFR